MGLTISIIGIFVALALMIFLLVKGWNVYISAIICSVVVCLTSNLNVYTTMTVDYMASFVSFLQGWFLVFLFGAIFGRLLTMVGAVNVVADAIINLFGSKAAMLMLPVTIGILVYCGVNAYVCIFAMFPLILAVFKAADAPKRLIPAMYLFASGTWCNGGPGTPQNLNVVATRALGVDTMACWLPGFVAVAAMLVIGLFWYNRFIQQAKANGEHFTMDPKLVQYEVSAEEADSAPRPSLILSLLPLIITILAVNIKVNGANLFKLEYALLIGIASVFLFHFKSIKPEKLTPCLADSATSAISMACATCAVLGFAGVVKCTEAFTAFINVLPSLNISPMLSLILSTNIVCAITGAASGSAAIVAPLLGPIYTAMGMSPAWVARLISISALGCDSVPHNGSIVAYINMTGETHKSAYKPIFCLCLVTPLIATAIMVAFALIIGVS